MYESWRRHDVYIDPEVVYIDLKPKRSSKLDYMDNNSISFFDDVIMYESYDMISKYDVHIDKEMIWSCSVPISKA